MPELLIRIKHHPDGSASLTCVRADGSTTWQRQRGSLGLVFPQHDLTHYAVETTLGYRRGFYGLIADGWEIGDFAKPWPRGAIPVEAQEVELVVGFFDAERRRGTPMLEDELREHAERYVEAQRARHPGRSVPAPPTLSAAELERVRAKRAELLGRWFALAPGETLELPFDRGER
ncbi:MAG: hypothetical protein ACJ8AO_16280 [Gemmatimonadaceae bacterium]